MKRLFSFFAVGVFLHAGLAGSAQSIGVLSGTTMMITGNTQVLGVSDIQVQDGGAIDNSGLVVLTGDWINDGLGLIQNSPGAVYFAGTQQQSIEGNQPTQFYDLRIDNPSGVLLSTDASVSGVLIFDNGLITTGSNEVILNATSPAPIQGAGAGSYVKGNLRVFFPTANSSFKYEIGDAFYAPLTADLTGVTSSGSVLGYTLTGPSPNEDTPTPNASGLDPAARADQHWVLAEDQIGFTSADVMLDYTNAGHTGSPANYVVAFNENTSQWTLPTSSANGTTVQASGLTTVNGEFVAGEVTPDGIDNMTIEEHGFLSLYPVPANDKLNLTFESSLPGPFSIRIFDMSGRVVYNQSRNAGSGRITHPIDLSDVAGGSYLLRVTGGDIFRTVPMVVQH
jgi:hypothetical protein